MRLWYVQFLTWPRITTKPPTFKPFPTEIRTFHTISAAKPHFSPVLGPRHSTSYSTSLPWLRTKPPSRCDRSSRPLCLAKKPSQASNLGVSGREKPRKATKSSVSAPKTLCRGTFSTSRRPRSPRGSRDPTGSAPWGSPR